MVLRDPTSTLLQGVREQVAFSLSHPLTKVPRAAGGLAPPPDPPPQASPPPPGSSPAPRRPPSSTASPPGSSPSNGPRLLAAPPPCRDYSKWRTGYSYPQNVLRNLARSASLTHYTLSLGDSATFSHPDPLDVDIVPSPGMASPLASFLAGNTCSRYLPTPKPAHHSLFDNPPSIISLDCIIQSIVLSTFPSLLPPPAGVPL